MDNNNKKKNLNFGSKDFLESLRNAKQNLRSVSVTNNNETNNIDHHKNKITSSPKHITTSQDNVSQKNPNYWRFKNSKIDTPSQKIATSNLNLHNELDAVFRKKHIKPDEPEQEVNNTKLYAKQKVPSSTESRRKKDIKRLITDLPSSPSFSTATLDQVSSISVSDSYILNLQSNYKSYSERKKKLIFDLVNLHHLKNRKKLKLLKQKRQIEIQKMKLYDTSLVKRSLTSYESIYKPHYEIYDEQQILENQLVFPSIVTKYDPNNLNSLRRASYIHGNYDNDEKYNYDNYTNSNNQQMLLSHINTYDTIDPMRYTSKFDDHFYLQQPFQIHVTNSNNLLQDNRNVDYNEVLKAIQDSEMRDKMLGLKPNSTYYVNGLMLTKPFFSNNNVRQRIPVEYHQSDNFIPHHSQTVRYLRQPKNRVKLKDLLKSSSSDLNDFASKLVLKNEKPISTTKYYRKKHKSTPRYAELNTKPTSQFDTTIRKPNTKPRKIDWDSRNIVSSDDNKPKFIVVTRPTVPNAQSKSQFIPLNNSNEDSILNPKISKYLEKWRKPKSTPSDSLQGFKFPKSSSNKSKPEKISKPSIPIPAPLPSQVSTNGLSRELSIQENIKEVEELNKKMKLEEKKRKKEEDKLKSEQKKSENLARKKLKKEEKAAEKERIKAENLEQKKKNSEQNTNKKTKLLARIMSKAKKSREEKNKKDDSKVVLKSKNVFDLEVNSVDTTPISNDVRRRISNTNDDDLNIYSLTRSENVKPSNQNSNWRNPLFEDNVGYNNNEGNTNSRALLPQMINGSS